MGRMSQRGLWMVCIVFLAGTYACSKKKSGEEAANREAPSAQEATASSTGNAPFASVITGKGFQVVEAKRFPAQVDARRATVVVYRSADGSRGGILYVRGFQDEPPLPVWHWFFADAAPDSVTAMDINRDGLWDARVTMAGGGTRDFIQNTDFTFRGPERESLMAMNGASSAAQDMWKVFDADTSTSWTSPASGAFLDIPNPLGIESGQLTVRLAGGSRPDKLEIGDGTRNIQECDLDATSEEQRFQLDASVKALATIRISVVGGGRSVAISELELQ